MKTWVFRLKGNRLFITLRISDVWYTGYGYYECCVANRYCDTWYLSILGYGVIIEYFYFVKIKDIEV